MPAYLQSVSLGQTQPNVWPECTSTSDDTLPFYHLSPDKTSAFTWPYLALQAFSSLPHVLCNFCVLLCYKLGFWYSGEHITIRRFLCGVREHNSEHSGLNPWSGLQISISMSMFCCLFLPCQASLKVWDLPADRTVHTSYPQGACQQTQMHQQQACCMF